MDKQVDSTFYNFLTYHDRERWVSYFFQIKEVLSFEPKNVLEVGVGSNILGPILKKEGIEYTSLDIAEDLHPDIVGSVDSIPLEDNSFDVVCAFEVLEHLPYERFESSLRELCRVAKKGVVVSLPHFGPPVKLSFKLPFFKERRFACKIPFLKKNIFNGQHYWEIGKRGYPAHVIRSVFQSNGKLVREYVPFDNQYHHFFILDVS